MHECKKQLRNQLEELSLKEHKDILSICYCYIHIWSIAKVR